ncbi:hypothetical protein AAD001_13850 [Colwelliaceae bacterium 6471]
MTDRKVKIESRNDQFTSRIKSEITQEVASDNNEFLAQEIRVHGYNVLDLMEQCDYIDVLFLLFNNELPTPEQKNLLRQLAVFLINLGPRHASSRAAANAGIGRTDVNHILPIGIMAMGGTYGGSKEVENSMRFLQKSLTSQPSEIAHKLLASNTDTDQGDWLVAPGFGTDFGGQSPFLIDVKNRLLPLAPNNGYLAWANKFTCALSENSPCGWRLPGLVAATFLDLNIKPRASCGIFQMLSAPGAFAHGIQFANKPITDIPFLKDDDYEINNDK